MILKTGTHIIDPRPKINILSEYLFPSSLTGLSLILPLKTGKIEATPAAAEQSSSDPKPVASPGPTSSSNPSF